MKLRVPATVVLLLSLVLNPAAGQGVEKGGVYKCTKASEAFPGLCIYPYNRMDTGGYAQLWKDEADVPKCRGCTDSNCDGCEEFRYKIEQQGADAFFSSAGTAFMGENVNVIRVIEDDQRRRAISGNIELGVESLELSGENGFELCKTTASSKSVLKKFGSITRYIPETGVCARATKDGVELEVFKQAQFAIPPIKVIKATAGHKYGFTIKIDNDGNVEAEAKASVYGAVEVTKAPFKLSAEAQLDITLDVGKVFSDPLSIFSGEAIKIEGSIKICIVVCFTVDKDGVKVSPDCLGSSTLYNGSQLMLSLPNDIIPGGEKAVHCVYRNTEHFCATQDHQVCIQVQGLEVSAPIGTVQAGSKLCDGTIVDHVTTEMMPLFSPTADHPIGDVVSLYGWASLPGTPFSYIRQVNAHISAMRHAGMSPGDLRDLLKEIAIVVKDSWTSGTAIEKIRAWNKQKSHLPPAALEAFENYIANDYVPRLFRTCFSLLLQNLYKGTITFTALFLEGPVKTCTIALMKDADLGLQTFEF